MTVCIKIVLGQSDERDWERAEPERAESGDMWIRYVYQLDNIRRFNSLLYFLLWTNNRNHILLRQIIMCLYKFLITEILQTVIII